MSLPQHWTPPAVVSAQVWLPPAVTAVSFTQAPSQQKAPPAHSAAQLVAPPELDEDVVDAPSPTSPARAQPGSTPAAAMDAATTRPRSGDGARGAGIGSLPDAESRSDRSMRRRGLTGGRWLRGAP